MIVKSLCNSCLQPYRLIIETRDVHLVKQISDDEGKLAKCPKLCGGMINLVGEPNITALTDSDKLRPAITLNGTQLYKAVMGAGLPHEIPHSPEVVEALLLAYRIKRVELTTNGKDIFLDEIHLGNGTVIHLTAGQRGAHVLKITKEGA